MDLGNLKELLECLSVANSTFLNGSLDLSDSNSTCGEEHFIPQEQPARHIGKHRDALYRAYNINSLIYFFITR